MKKTFPAQFIEIRGGFEIDFSAGVDSTTELISCEGIDS